jgi:putative membrane protein
MPTFNPLAISRPDPTLMKYYTICAILTGPLFPIAFLPLLFKYETLKYRFDNEGVSMAWGILFRRETYLTYRRIQDIHVSRNIIQRWMGLATVSIQTASGSSTPEMAIEGVLEYDALRDFLYQKMRGARGLHDTPVAARATDNTPSNSDVSPHEPLSAESAEALSLLRDIRDSLQKRANR